MYLESVPQAFAQLSIEGLEALIFLLVPTSLLYFSIYAHVKGYSRIYKTLTYLSIACFWLCPWLTPIICGPVRCLQNFASMTVLFLPLYFANTRTVGTGTMKLLDIYARRHELPAYTAAEKRPADLVFAFIVLAELRYESFTPNHIRQTKGQENFSEPLQLLFHLAIFVVLQNAPQHIPTILAFEVLLAIYIIWTSMQQILRYKTSPALFGPLYRADSLTGFWSESWHNVFAAPCTSLAYNPIRSTLPKLGVPVPVARSVAVMGAFGLMAIFHIYALSPILPRDSLVRIGLFFFINGIATCTEAAIWGRKRHWLKAVLAWSFEIVLATWTAEAARIPNGLSRIPWRSMCMT
jgi:hypothetical protein